MSKLGDLIVRMRLQYDDYKKGLKKADADTKGFAGTLGKIKGVGLAVWGAVGASVTAFAKAFVNHSQVMGDKWNVGVSQMKAVWDQFLTSLTNWDWEGFGDRIKGAMDKASRRTAAHDAEFEVGNSIKMRKAAMAEELAALQVLMRDTRKSYDERAKAAQDYLDKVAPLYQAEIDLRRRIYMTDTDEYLTNAGLATTADNRDLLRTFFTDIAPNESLVAILNEYQKKVQGKKKYELSQADYKALDAFYAQYGDKGGAALSVLAQYYQGTNDKTANKAIEAIVNYDNSLAAFLEETRRIRTVQNSALAQIGSVSETMVQAIERQNLSLPSVNAVQGGAMSFMPDLIPSEWLEEQKSRGLEAVEMQAEWLNIMQNAALQMENTIINSTGNALQAITDLMFGLNGADASQILAAFIAPFGEMAKSMGAMIMSYGISMEAFKEAFKNPYVAIAAGAGLMAIGAAISSGAQKIASGSMGGSSASAHNGGYSGANQSIQNYENTLTVYVEGRVSGSDILIAGSNQQNQWNR